MLARYDIGFDYGNGETAAVMSPTTGEGLQWHILPSFVGSGSLAELARFRSLTTQFARQSDALQAGEYVLHYGGSEYFVGHLALSQGQLATSARGDSSRYWSERALQLLLTVAGTLISDGDFGLHLVTGIPIETYQQSTRHNVKQALEGEHTFVLNGEERTAQVTVAAVIMEGAGALIAYGRSESVPQAAVDIGSRTTDLYSAQGHVPLTPFCKGAPLGVELVMDAVNRSIEESYGRSLSLQERRMILRAHIGSGQYPPIFVNGQPIEHNQLQRWTEEALRRIGSEIASFTAQCWQSNEQGRVAANLAQVLLIGGGAYYFYQDLVSRIPHLIVPLRPELANARGYRALAAELRLRREAV